MTEWIFTFPKEAKNPISTLIFKRGERLDRGGQGAIFTFSLENEIDMTKYVGKESFFTFGTEIYDEFRTMYNIKSDFVAEVIKFCKIENQDYMIMKQYKKSLYSFIFNEEYDIDSEEYRLQILIIITTLFAGVRHLHVLKNSLMHHDLTPKNIMLDDSGNSVLIDFGLLKFNKTITLDLRTRNYSTEGKYTQRSELIVIGMIMIELINKCQWFNYKNIEKQDSSESYKKLIFSDDYEPIFLEKIIAIIIDANEKDVDCLSQIMKILTNRKEFKDRIGSDYLSDESLDIYFKHIFDLNIIMNYQENFRKIAPLIYGEKFDYESFLYSMFHQLNYKYNKADFNSYQNEIIKIFEKHDLNDKGINHHELMKDITLFHIRINSFRLNCLLHKFYFFAKNQNFNTNDDENTFKSKLFQILFSLDFGESKSLKYFADSLNMVLYGCNQHTIRSIKSSFGIDAKAKFNMLFSKAIEIKNEKRTDILLHNCFRSIFSSERDFNKKKTLNTLTSLLGVLGLNHTYKYQIQNDDDEEEELEPDKDINNFRGMTFEEFARFLQEDDKCDNIDYYESMNYYSKGVRERFLNKMRDRFGEDFLFITILFFIKNIQNIEKERKYFLMFMECFEKYEDDYYRLIFDMEMIYEYKEYIQQALCYDTQVKCKEIVPECLLQLDLDSFYQIIDKLRTDETNQSILKYLAFLRKYNINKASNEVNSVLECNEFLNELLENKDICKKFFDNNFVKVNFGDKLRRCVLNGKIYDLVSLGNNQQAESIDEKLNFNFIIKTSKVFNYNGGKYQLRNNSQTLSEYLEKENPNEEQRTIICFHLAYYFSFLTNLPYFVSFEIKEEYILVDNETGIPMLHITPSTNNNNYFQQLKDFGEVLKKIAGKGDDKKITNVFLDSTINSLIHASDILRYEDNNNETLLPLFTDIFYDFFDKSINYTITGTNYQKFQDSITEKFRYDLQNESFRCIANRLFGFEYLFKLDYLFMQLKDDSDLNHSKFVDEICRIVDNEKSNPNNFLDNNDVIKQLIDLLENNFNNDSYGFIHSLYQMYYYNIHINKLGLGYRTIEDDISDSNLISIYCQKLAPDREKIAKLYGLTFKYISPLKYVKNQSEFYFEIPSTKFSFEAKGKELFNIIKDKNTFITTLIAALSFLCKYSNKEDFLLQGEVNFDEIIYINEKAEAILLPYKIKSEEAISIITSVLKKFDYISKDDVICSSNENILETFYELYFKYQIHFYTFKCANLVPFGYNTSCNLRKWFGLDYISALNQHFHFKIFKKEYFLNLITDKIVKFSNLLSFSKTTNCLSPLFIQTLEQSLYDDELKNEAEEYLKLYRSINEITKDKISLKESNMFSYKSSNSTFSLCKYKGQDVILKELKYHTRGCLQQIKRMLWRMNLIYRDKVAKEYFINELGFCGFSIVMDYYEKGDLLDNFYSFESISDKLHLIFSIVEGIRYLHNNNIIHHDLKPNNIFIDSNNRPRIADLITMTPEENMYEQNDAKMEERNVATNFYFKDGLTSSQKDIYALTIMCIEILLGRKILRDFDFENDKINYLTNDVFAEIKSYNEEDRNKILMFKKIILQVLNRDTNDNYPTIASFVSLRLDINGDIEKNLQSTTSWTSLNDELNNLNDDQKANRIKEYYDSNKNNEKKIYIQIGLSEKIHEIMTRNTNENTIINTIAKDLGDTFDDYIDRYYENNGKKDLDLLIEKNIKEIAYGRILLKKFNLNNIEDSYKFKHLLNLSFDKAYSISQNSPFNSDSLEKIKIIIQALNDIDDFHVGFFYSLLIPEGKPMNDTIADDMKLRFDSIAFYYRFLENQYLKTKKSKINDSKHNDNSDNNNHNEKRRREDDDNKKADQNEKEPEGKNKKNKSKQSSKVDKNNKEKKQKDDIDECENNTEKPTKHKNRSSGKRAQDDDDDSHQYDEKTSIDDDDDEYDEYDGYKYDHLALFVIGFLKTIIEHLENADSNNKSEYIDNFKKYLIGEYFDSKWKLTKASFISLFFCIYIENFDEFAMLDGTFSEIVMFFNKNYIEKTENVTENDRQNQFFIKMVAITDDFIKNGQKRVDLYDEFVLKKKKIKNDLY